MIEVPDFVGVPFHIARDEAEAIGLTLANPDPDGPPIGALAWPGLFYVTHQSPSPGAKVRPGSHVKISILPHDPPRLETVR